MASFTSIIQETRYLTPDVLFISMTAPEEFTFQAGQFITFMMEKNGEKKPRSYSIFNPPSEKKKIDLCIKIVDKGFASDIFTHSQKDTRFEIKGPFGHFIFDPSPDINDHWFICTGTGFTPMYSMIKELLSQHPSKQFKLFWGLRHKKDIFYHQELEQLRKNHKNFNYLISLSQDDHSYTGHIQKHLGNDFKGKIFYICGLKDFVLETKELLEKAQVPKERIKFERYS